jgi:hypothetical protein
MIDNGNGTVTDETTGLMWQQVTSEKIMNWNQAVVYCKNLKIGNYKKGWRLPTITELRSLVDFSRYNPAIDMDCFPNTVLAFHWSSSTEESPTKYAWGVAFSYGQSYIINTNRLHYVRAVKGPIGDTNAIRIRQKNR